MAEAVQERNRVARWALPTLLVVSAGTLAGAFLLPVPAGKRHPGDLAPVADAVPPFALTERSGRPVSNADLAGKVWVASFVFTRCTGPCPSVTATMARLQTELDLAGRPDLRLVTFTVDPERDTQAELTKYADNFRADKERWLFLTGKEDEIHRLARDGFKLGVNRSRAEKPPAGQEFDHSTLLMLVDKQGRIRGHFDGYRGEHDPGGRKFEDGLAGLKETVAALLKE